MRFGLMLGFFLWTFETVQSADPIPIQIHVSTSGLDTSSGRAEEPLATLVGARDLIRSLRDSGHIDDRAIEVLVRPGVYRHPHAIEFTLQDSGTEEFPIRYRSVGGQAILSGGIALHAWTKLERSDLFDRIPFSARPHAVCLDLRASGIDPGLLQPRRLNQEMPASPLQIFDGQKTLPRAGWPNQGWAHAFPNATNQWQLDRTIHPKDANHVWAHGFWQHDWSDSFEPIALAHDRVTASLRSTDSSRPSTLRAGARYRIANALSELDAPGEWFLDLDSGLLICWPENKESSSTLSAAVVETLISIYDVEYVVFEGFRFESARSMVVEIVGGCNVELKKCVIANAGQVAIHVFRGKNHHLYDCEVFCSGSSAVRIEGGDRSTLTSSGHRVEECEIHDFCQDYLAGRPGVALYGVGITLCRNSIHDGPDVGIGLNGNEHLVEHNEIARVCKETDDTGAIYLSYDPTYRGNMIRRNYIHDLGGFSKTGVIGIYLDDFASGTVVSDNYLRNTIRGIVIGGGSDNRIENNIVRESLAAIQIDARGLTWESDMIQGENSAILTLCRNTITDSPISLQRYPELSSVFRNDLATPRGNVVRRNLFETRIGIDLQGIARELVAIDGNSRWSADRLATHSQVRTESILAQLGIELSTNTRGRTVEPERTFPVSTPLESTSTR